jgi:hypothetical protein
VIISASRRTDIPAFYAEWFINRIRAGFCDVPNPFNRDQVTRVSLRPEDVDVIVFWTRNLRPLFRHLDELDRLGYRYYFQYTLLNNPRPIDAACPPLPMALCSFRELAARVGPERVIWRYDPIILSNMTDTDFHRRTYMQIAEALRGHTQRSVVSLMDVYRKAVKRLQKSGVRYQTFVEASSPWEAFPRQVGELLTDLAAMAAANGMEIVSCAEELDLQPYGIRPGKCVDDEYIARTFGIRVDATKDPGQRAACGCIVSKDIGMYDSCLFGCRYCYATASFELARRNYEKHDPAAASLIGQKTARQV